tara:strand:- start:1725 stop:2201 length:477 start_codon:yes stop_codon:yes gene_type:complete
MPTSSARLGELFAEIIATRRALVEGCLRKKVQEEEARISANEVMARKKGWERAVKEDVRNYIHQILANCESKYGTKAAEALRQEVDHLYQEPFNELVRARTMKNSAGRGRKRKRQTRKRMKKKHHTRKKSRKHLRHKKTKKHRRHKNKAGGGRLSMRA